MSNVSRDDFFKEIEKIMYSHQFEKTDAGYICVQKQQQPGTTININGQVMQQPPTLLENKFIITLLGEGWIGDADEENKQYFEQVRYEVFQNNNRVSIIEECFYYDEFDKIMRNFLPS